MPQGNWQLDAVYKDIHTLDSPGYAFEYLRRNSKFISDTHRLETHLKRGTISRAMRDAYARRWGMRFREVCAPSRTSEDSVDDDSSSKRHSADTYPSGI